MKEFIFFQKLEQKNQELIKRSSTFVTKPEGKILYQQGDICPDVLFLTKGRVRVVRENKNGKSILLYYFSEGEQCNVNFTSTFNSAPAVGTAIAETDLEGYILKADLITKLFIEDKEFQRYVFDQYIDRIEHMASLVEDIRFNNIEERLYSYLKSKNSEQIYISHQELADILGTSREVVSRVLKGLEKNDLVALSKKCIKIKHCDDHHIRN